jgi:hypothetical protein
MPKSDTCVIGVDLAIALRQVARALRFKAPEEDLGFRCIECGQPVKTTDESSAAAAHFEHLDRNPSCSLSDPLR